jgi:hypothetical protein
MGQQVKVPEDVKREVEAFSGITGRTQGELLADSWREYRQRHAGEFREALRWASSVLADPVAASVVGSGMSAEDLQEIEAAASGTAAPAPESARAAAARGA